MKRILFLLLIFPFVDITAFNQEGIHSLFQDTINLDEVVVTGTSVKVNRNNIPMAVSIVNTEQIKQSNETSLLPILNGRIPGLFVTQRGIMGFGVSAGAAGQISVRGVGGSPTTGVLMLIDGHPQFMGIFGHPLPDSYVASDVERVEVIRGPASILYGSNAMGGVINIITKKQEKEGLQANAHFMYGSYDTRKYMGSAGFKKGKISLFASVNHDQTDGHRPNSDFKITNGYIKAGYEINENIDFTSDLSLAGFNAKDPGPDTLNANTGNSLDIKRGYWSMTINNNYEKYSGTVKLFYNFGEHKISDGFHSNDRNYGVNIYEAARLFEGNSLTVGADYLIYGGKAENEIYNSFITDTTVHDAGFYIFVQQKIFEGFSINSGIRLQDHSVYGRKLIPAGGFSWRVGSLTTWKSSVARGFRSPTIRELFIWNHNVDLDPETIMNYETGIIQNIPAIRLKLELTGFTVKGNNMIITVPMKGLQNAGKVSNTGIEFSASAKPTENLSLDLTYSYIGMKYPVYATPRHNLFGSTNYSFRKFRFALSAQYIDHLDTDPLPGKESYQTYLLIDSKVSFNLQKWCEMFVSGENLLNQEYENNIYYPMPGITFFGGVKLGFQ